LLSFTTSVPREGRFADRFKHLSAAVALSWEALKLQPDNTPEHAALSHVLDVCTLWKRGDEALERWDGQVALSAFTAAQKADVDARAIEATSGFYPERKGDIVYYYPDYRPNRAIADALGTLLRENSSQTEYNGPSEAECWSVHGDVELSGTCRGGLVTCVREARLEIERFSHLKALLDDGTKIMAMPDSSEMGLQPATEEHAVRSVVNEYPKAVSWPSTFYNPRQNWSVPHSVNSLLAFESYCEAYKLSSCMPDRDVVVSAMNACIEKLRTLLEKERHLFDDNHVGDAQLYFEGQSILDDDSKEREGSSYRRRWTLNTGPPDRGLGAKALLECLYNIVEWCGSTVEAACTPEVRPIADGALMYYESQNGKHVQAPIVDVPALISSGVITGATQVWMEEGIEDWVPLSELEQHMDGLSSMLQGLHVDKVGQNRPIAASHLQHLLGVTLRSHEEMHCCNDKIRNIPPTKQKISFDARRSDEAMAMMSISEADEEDEEAEPNEFSDPSGSTSTHEDDTGDLERTIRERNEHRELFVTQGDVYSATENHVLSAQKTQQENLLLELRLELLHVQRARRYLRSCGNSLSMLRVACAAEKNSEASKNQLPLQIEVAESSRFRHTISIKDAIVSINGDALEYALPAEHSRQSTRSRSVSVSTDSVTPLPISSDAGHLAVLLAFYAKFDNSKSRADVVTILAKRKNGAAVLPMVQFQELCSQLAKKYGEEPMAVYMTSLNMTKLEQASAKSPSMGVRPPDRISDIRSIPLLPFELHTEQGGWVHCQVLRSRCLDLDDDGEGADETKVLPMGLRAANWDKQWGGSPRFDQEGHVVPLNPSRLARYPQEEVLVSGNFTTRKVNLMV
jgi:hypothetical protein